MPGGDRKGPMGEGPMTGRGLGFCAGNDTPGSVGEVNQGRGMGRGMGRGLGRRFRHGQSRGWGFRFGMRDNLSDQMDAPENIKSNKIKKKKKK